MQPPAERELALKVNETYLILDFSMKWHQWDWIEWRDKVGKLLKSKDSRLMKKGNPIDLKPGK